VQFFGHIQQYAEKKFSLSAKLNSEAFLSHLLKMAKIQKA
jgi:hypothetical protein